MPGWEHKRAGTLLVAAILAIATSVAAAPAAMGALPASIEALHAGLRSGTTTCTAVTADALAQIRRARGLRAVLETNPDAMGIAAGLDAEQQASGGALRPLHCLPLLVKDNYETADRLQTTVGSLTMLGFRAPRDAFIVARLRAAGAVVLGKTNMDEWAHGATGYSSRGGQTRNGRRALRQPGGSSGGSASAVAAGLALVGTGSDTGGSIQIPAAFNGIVGLRPTMGLISRGGIVPYSAFSDAPGPLTRSVADLARVLGTFTGVDPDDPATLAGRGHFHSDYTPFLDPNGLRGARVGVLRRMLSTPLTGHNRDVDRALTATLRTMRSRGTTVVDGLSLPAPRGFRVTDVAGPAIRQFKPEINAWFRGDGRTAPVRSLAQVIRRSANPRLQRPVRVLDFLRGDQRAAPPRGPAYDRAVRRLRQIRNRLLGLMRRHRLDAVIFPATGCPAPPLPGRTDPTYRCQDARPPFKFGEIPGSLAPILSPVTGLPVLTISVGRLPGNQRAGLNLLGRDWSEPELIRLGYALERASS